MYKIILILLIFFNFNLTNAQEKVAYLNLEFLIQNTISGKKMLNNIDDINENNNKIFKNREKKIRDTEQDLINKKNILSEDEFRSKISELKKSMDIFNLDKRKSDTEFEKKRKSLLDNYLVKIKPIIEEYIKLNSISLVLNKNHVVIADKKFDITNDLIKIIDEKIK